MTISEDVLHAGQRVAAADQGDLTEVLVSALRPFITPPYVLRSGSIVTSGGDRSSAFAAVITLEYPVGHQTATNAEIDADYVIAIIDANSSLNESGLQAAYARIAAAKGLQRSPRAHAETDERLTSILGIIYAQSTPDGLDRLGHGFLKLNSQTPSRLWPDAVVVAGVGTVHHAVHFPSNRNLSDYLPPADGALATMIPPFYVVPVLGASGTHAFNKLLSLLIANMARHSPSAQLVSYQQVLEGVPKSVITLPGYQYNLSGNLVLVPDDQYVGRFLPRKPIVVERPDAKKEVLANLMFQPWQDGGVVLLEGKIPLTQFLQFLGPAAKGARVLTPDTIQISTVMPINEAMFHEMVHRFGKAAKLNVRPNEGRWVVQKLADEGSTSPFMARLYLGVYRLRDNAMSGKEREQFDLKYNLAISPLMNARDIARETANVWATYKQDVEDGKIARIEGGSIYVDRNIDRELRKQTEDFANAAVRCLKQGIQNLCSHLGTDIGRLFKQEPAFRSMVAELMAREPLMGRYIESTRTWSEPLLNLRNGIEHEGWELSPVTFDASSGRVVPHEPEICGQPMTAYLDHVTDRLCRTVEELTVAGLMKHLPQGVTVMELPSDARNPICPERFSITLAVGGTGAWTLSYSAARFEEI